MRRVGAVNGGGSDALIRARVHDAREGLPGLPQEVEHPGLVQTAAGGEGEAEMGDDGAEKEYLC